MDVAQLLNAEAAKKLKRRPQTGVTPLLDLMLLENSCRVFPGIRLAEGEPVIEIDEEEEQAQSLQLLSPERLPGRVMVPTQYKPGMLAVSRLERASAIAMCY
eukprot:6470682-Amphidinium_carterae.1